MKYFINEIDIGRETCIHKCDTAYGTLKLLMSLAEIKGIAWSVDADGLMEILLGMKSGKCSELRNLLAHVEYVEMADKPSGLNLMSVENKQEASND